MRIFIPVLRRSTVIPRIARTKKDVKKYYTRRNLSRPSDLRAGHPLLQYPVAVTGSRDLVVLSHTSAIVNEYHMISQFSSHHRFQTYRVLYNITLYDNIILARNDRRRSLGRVICSRSRVRRVLVWACKTLYVCVLKKSIARKVTTKIARKSSRHTYYGRNERFVNLLFFLLQKIVLFLWRVDIKKKKKGKYRIFCSLRQESVVVCRVRNAQYFQNKYIYE